MVPFNDTTFPMITKNYRNELVNLKRSRSGGIYFPFKYRNEISKLEFNNFTQSRILVLGDESVGKSSLIDKVLDNSTGFEKGVLNYCGNTLTFINLIDVSIRKHQYPVDCCLICYSIASWKSFENVKKRYIPEVSYYSPNIPIILVGTKADLGDNERRSYYGDLMRKVSFDDGETLARQINAISFIEISSKTGEGFEDLVDFLIRVQLLSKEIILKEKQSKWNCIIL